jgi:bacteriorhodopsin
VLGGQAGSPSQWVWYVIGVVGFLAAIAILMSIAQTF